MKIYQSHEIRRYLDILSENSMNSIHLPFKTFKFTVFDGAQYSIVGWSNRAFIVIDINGIAMPFYLSSGLGGKANVPSGKWYPFFGVGADGWLNKGSQDIIAAYYGSNILETVCKKLDTVIGDIRSNINTLPAADYQTVSSVTNKDTAPVRYGNPIGTWNNINETLKKIKSDPLLRPYVDSQVWLLKNRRIEFDTFNKNIDDLVNKFPQKRKAILGYLKSISDNIELSDGRSIFEAWSKKYKKSINCKNPKGFSQKAHCAGRKKRQAHGTTRSKPINENRKSNL